MSLAILWQVTGKEEVDVVYEVADDLVSFFYIFAWICVLYTGPNGALSTLPEDVTLIVHGWGEAAMVTGGLVHALNAKNMFIHAPNQIINKQFTPYFQNLKQLAHKWKALIKAEDECREQLRLPDHDQLGQPSEPLIHQTVIELLRCHADTLSPIDPLLQTCPNTPPPPCLNASLLKRPPLSLSTSVTLTTLTKKHWS